ncbi:hypothetical protein AB9P05_21185 [Roseivirga sp. BDSF3-8]|uniref:hypothetical protein n=1 Tax=Roseivirga sp. BDSF3-8 TaxID=3241598 RepID=UPI003532283E
MRSFKSILPHCAILLAVCLVFPLSSYGQDVRRYTGPFQAEDYSGKADFGYYIQENDTILEGPFQLQRSDLDPLLTEGSQYFSFKGGYKNDLPIGNWQFQFGDFQATENASLVDYQYNVKVKGALLEVSGEVGNGKFQGEWTQTVKRLENSNVDTTLFLSTIQFKDGYPQKSFRIEDDEKVLLGRVLRDGLAHDVWELYDKKVPDPIEYWHFNEGRLEKIVSSRNGESESLEIFGSNIENAQTIDLDERYARILALRYATDEGPESSTIGLLTENAANYQKLDNVYTALGKPVFISAFKVQVAHFPLDKAQKKQLDEIRANLKKAEAISNELLSNTQLQLIKLTDEEVLYLLSSVKSLNEELQAPISQLITYYEEDILQFVQKDNVLKALWPQAKPAAIEVTYNNGNDTITRTFTGPGADDFTFDTYDLSNVNQLAQYTFQSIDSIRRALDKKLMHQDRRKDLEDTEERMIAEMTHLSGFVDSLSNVVSGPYQNALQSIKATANGILKRYSEMKDANPDSQQADLLLTCLSQMDELAIAVSTLPAREEEIQQAYTKEVWNPFTFTYMNEKTKKPITSAYQNILVPYLLEKISTNLSCDNAETLLRYNEAIYQRTLDMKDEGTGKVERKLKRERDPQEVLQLFDVPSYMEKIDE